MPLLSQLAQLIINSMPVNNPQDDTALTNALTALATATTANTTAVNANATSIANAVNKTNTTVASSTATVGTAPTLLAGADDNRTGFTVSNISNVKIRIWITDAVVPNTTTYNTLGYAYELNAATPNSIGGVFEVPDPLFKGNIYAIAASGTNNTVAIISTVAV